MSAYSCFDCHKISPVSETAPKKCPLCGGTNGEVISNDRLQEGLDSGVYYNIDPRTGKRTKKKK